MDILYAMHDCALGISPVTSYSGVKQGVDTVLVQAVLVEELKKLECEEPTGLSPAAGSGAEAAGAPAAPAAAAAQKA